MICSDIASPSSYESASFASFETDALRCSVDRANCHPLRNRYLALTGDGQMVDDIALLLTEHVRLIGAGSVIAVMSERLDCQAQWLRSSRTQGIKRWQVRCMFIVFVVATNLPLSFCILTVTSNEPRAAVYRPSPIPKPQNCHSRSPM